ncbi:hypothetical protein ABZ816_33375 [Actinosynnema sp. NPDC047251]|uniref:Uncharacterized protein n=1 Tax=Saccharothrix espanaensis (strain ATCC 51144 / DSM 44229 / JCM 9112 / NBRC 15066 / NRRL 15764) TaxID=1179773 RepID=K0JYJ3_SACES|nr:hypothetical protein [Saccharothrix espanaensis]CCH33005.1 hypothetical protein BN6_57470 [Saccharothrix espanaensis DSM 44229]
MDEVLAANLHDGLTSILDAYDLMATEGGPTAHQALADSAVPRLTGTLRDLLDQHRSDPRGRCRICQPRWRIRPPRCRVLLIAHQHLIAVETPATPTRAARHATPAGPAHPRPAGA